MYRVSVLVPTHNRPRLLEQALQSLDAQTAGDIDVIVIDDGSNPPVDEARVRAATKWPVTLLRHETARGQAWSREEAGALAMGDFVLHLDDDDMLAPQLIERGLAAFERDATLGVVYFAVEGFGKRAGDFNRAQSAALEGVLRATSCTKTDAGTLRLGSDLFQALLHSVPMAFQRPMARRAAWQQVTRMRRETYGDAHPLLPPLREAEWTLYAAATQAVALVTDRLYLQRCEDQGYFSVQRQHSMAAFALVDVFDHLAQAANTHGDVMRWRPEVVKARARCHFDLAYEHFFAGSRRAAYASLRQALALECDPDFLRFGVRMLLPRFRPNGAHGTRAST
jgi:glycosyltransferase involved in cell wall biosynthesis